MRNILIGVVILLLGISIISINAQNDDQEKISRYHQRIVDAKALMVKFKKGIATRKEKDDLLYMLATERYGE